MKNRIYTYADLTTIENNSWFKEIKEYPQITVSSDLCKGIKRKNSKYKVRDFRQVLDNIIPNWTTDETKFQETVILAQYLREKVAITKDEEEKKWLVGCRRNLSSILSAIILLEEAKVVPEDLMAEDKNMELFIEMWKELIEREPEISEFREKMQGIDSSVELKSLMEVLFGNSNDKSIVIHGFYYFTPIQRRVFKVFEDNGYELIYLFPFDERYTVANEIWLDTYSSKRGLLDFESWIVETVKKESTLGSLLEGQYSRNSEKITVYEYRSILEYVNDMRRAKQEGFSIYSSAYRKANTILKDFFPEEFGERKLLSYPVGQFVFTLNKMWDEDEQTILLNADNLRQCFSSGWLSIDEVSSKDYTKDLEYVLPFFEKCKTIDEWNDRITLLENIEEYVIEPFKAKVSVHPEADKRWQGVCNNPFNSFSMFAVPSERLNKVLDLISRLIDMAQELFASDQEIVIGEHIRKLDRLLKQNENAKDIYSEERIIINELFNKFDKTKNSKVRCFPADIATALSLLLEGSYEDEEIRAHNVGMVYPMYQVDAACIKKNSKVHICMCDIKEMPGVVKDYVWPLTEKVVKDAYAKTNNTYLGLLIQIMEVTPICNRYFLYSALKNKDVELSWINNMNGKLLAASPYIQILSVLGGIEISKMQDYMLNYPYVDKVEMATKEISKYNFNDDEKYIAKEARMDYAVCPMRYVYGYVLEQYPSYQTTFLHNYAANGLIAAIYFLLKDSGVSVKEIQSQVLSLFPNLRKIEKCQIVDYLKIEAEDKNTDLGMTSEYADVAYTDERLKIKFPYKEIREAAKEKYGELVTPSGRKDINLHESTDVARACVFCQHADYCKNAVFMLDQEAAYD
ncbi:MAG: hypothetical protein IIW54_07560 [Lachnospiraceae bacterium]|nr:hypothetical protein [Lachnospiraceae bacterium]